MLQPWFSLLVTVVTGSLMSAIVTVLYHRWNTRQAAKAKEKGAIAALAAELRHSRLLCDHNANLKDDSTAPFICFPTTVALDVTFRERHSYPQLASRQKALEAYTMGMMHINQLIDSYRLLWTSPEVSTTINPGAAGRREQLRFQIADLCAGRERLKAVEYDSSITLPKFIDAELAAINCLIQ